MASRKSKVKFDIAAALPAPNQAGMCKTKCGKKSSTSDGWCATCYAKFKKGYYIFSGDISPVIIRKQQAIAEKRMRREARKVAKQLELIKESLSTKLTSIHLKVLPTQSPEADKPKYCEKLAFWTSDTVCYSRLFIVNNKRCNKCKIHDASFEALLQFVENYDAKGSEITAAQDINATDDSARTNATDTASNQ